MVSSPDSWEDPHAPHAPHLSPEQLPHAPHLSPEQLPLHAYEEQAPQVAPQHDLDAEQEAEAQHCLLPLHELHEVDAQQFNSRCEMLVEEHTPEQALHSDFDAEQEEQLDPAHDEPAHDVESHLASSVPEQALHSFDPAQEEQHPLAEHAPQLEQESHL